MTLREQFGDIDIYLFDQLLARAHPSRHAGSRCRMWTRPQPRLPATGGSRGVRDGRRPERGPRGREPSRRRWRPPCRATHFKAEAVESMTIPTSSMDAVISSAVLHFARDDRAFRGDGPADVADARARRPDVLPACVIYRDRVAGESRSDQAGTCCRMAASGTWSRSPGSSNSRGRSAGPSSIRSRAPSSRTCAAWRRGWSVLLADLVAASVDVTQTPARLRRSRGLLTACANSAPPDVAIAVPFLTGTLRQGRIGVGFAAIREAADVTAASEPTLTLADVDRAFEEVAMTRGAGSIARPRRAAARALWSSDVPTSRTFLVRLLHGELRQGAVEGVSSMRSRARLPFPPTVSGAPRWCRARSRRSRLPR